MRVLVRNGQQRHDLGALHGGRELSLCPARIILLHSSSSRFLQDRTSFLETNFFAAEGYVIQSQNVVYKHCKFSELSSDFKH